MVKDYSRITFPVMFDMVPYAFLTNIATFINWLTEFLTRQSRKRLRSLHDVSQKIRIRLNDTGVEAVEESAALQDNFPGTGDPLNCQYPVLRSTQLNK
jgi:hypothetical protein